MASWMKKEYDNLFYWATLADLYEEAGMEGPSQACRMLASGGAVIVHDRRMTGSNPEVEWDLVLPPEYGETVWGCRWQRRFTLVDDAYWDKVNANEDWFRHPRGSVEECFLLLIQKRKGC